MSFQRQKVKNMLLYFSSEIPQITSIKLQKAMLLADRYNWAVTGTSVSGLQYVKKPFGPVMEKAGQRILSSLDNDSIDVEYEPMPGDCEKVMRTAIASVDYTLFSDTEKHSLSFARDFVREHSTEELSTMTHDAAWEAAEDGEPIPYESSVCINFDANDEPTEEETAAAFSALAAVDKSLLVGEAV